MPIQIPGIPFDGMRIVDNVGTLNGHARPILSEAVHEAALGIDKRAIHRAN